MNRAVARTARRVDRHAAKAEKLRRHLDRRVGAVGATQYTAHRKYGHTIEIRARHAHPYRASGFHAGRFDLEREQSAMVGKPHRHHPAAL